MQQIAARRSQPDVSRRILRDGAHDAEFLGRLERFPALAIPPLHARLIGATGPQATGTVHMQEVNIAALQPFVGAEPAQIAVSPVYESLLVRSHPNPSGGISDDT